MTTRKPKPQPNAIIGGHGRTPGNRTNPRTSHINAGIPAANPLKGAPEIHSYEDACAFFEAKAKPGTLAAKLGPNTLLVELPSGYVTDGAQSAYAVRLYETDIIRYFPDGTFAVDNGGWNTPTTITRMTQFGPKGWRFGHKNRLLHANGRAVSPSDRLPVRREGGAA